MLVADRAVDLCSQLNVLSSPTITNIETLTAVANSSYSLVLPLSWNLR